MQHDDVGRLIGRLRFRHLQMIVAIAEERHLVGAAQRLHITQSAITKSLQETEALLGVPLFDRTSRGVMPTIFGQSLLLHSRVLLAQLGHVSEELSDLKDGGGGRIAVGTLHAAAAFMLPTAIARLRKNRPKVIISITDGTDDLLMPALRAGELDFVVGRLPDDWHQAALTRETLLQDIACLVVRPGHPLEGRENLHLRDLLAWDWILPSQQTTLRRQLEAAFHNEGVEPPPHSVESVSLLTNLNLLGEADYLSVWPWQAAYAEARTGRIAILPIVLGATAGPIGLTLRQGTRLSPACEHLLALLRTVAQEVRRSPFLASCLAAPPAGPPERVFRKENRN